MITNADIIRGFTDDEMLDFLEKWELGDVDYAQTFCDLCKGDSKGMSCSNCRTKWLKTDCRDSYFGLEGGAE